MKYAFLLLLLYALNALNAAFGADLRGKISVAGKGAGTREEPAVIVYLTPTGRSLESLKQDTPEGSYRLIQKDKRFSPHLLLVPLGATVAFPNEDRVFHNVFSVYEGTPFDLGLYEAGSMKYVRFTKPGPSYIFCNIHPEMSAVVFALPTPYYAVSDGHGNFRISGVPEGEYVLHIWSERAKESELHSVAREVQVRGDMTLPPITVVESASIAQGHKNKFGKDYDLPNPTKYP
jgi:plastocyanin